VPDALGSLLLSIVKIVLLCLLVAGLFFFGVVGGRMVTRLSERRRQVLLGGSLLLLGMLTLLSLASYLPGDYGLLAEAATSVSNMGGMAGAYLAHWLMLLMGKGSYLLPVLLLLWGINLIGARAAERVTAWTFWLILLTLWFCTLISLPHALPDEMKLSWGGLIGGYIGALAIRYVGRIGAYLLLAGAALVAVLVILEGRMKFLGGGSSKVSVLFSRFFRRVISLRSGSRQRRKREEEARVPSRRRKRTPELAPAEVRSIATPVAVEEVSSSAEPAEPEPEPEVAAPPRYGADRTYQEEFLSFLKDPLKVDTRQTREELEQNADALEGKLADFDAHGRVVHVAAGPVITRYEFEPATGVKVNRIANLADDLALAMRASRIRVVAPVPGKAVVGIEIPNRRRSPVYLKEVLAAEQYLEHESKLAVPLGLDIAGTPYVTDLARMPHLLVAGATGSGKSVCINVIVTSVLLRTTPYEVRFLLIDPKRLELTLYDGIPHLIMPVVTEAGEGAKALATVVSWMERRYKHLAADGVRDIQSHNARLAPGERPMPYILIVIDELSDLMLMMPTEIEKHLGRLAHMSRAVGIHLVLATQRPSVDVLTGVIKANFPSRIAFQVASKTDSRTILDVNGAEKLLGQGDMLFLAPGSPEPVRIHGAFVSSDETQAIVRFLRTLPAAGAMEEEVVPRLEEDESEGLDQPDELFEQAKLLVIRHQIGSVSLLQRRLKVGYARAGRLMDQLEAAGVVGPYEGSKAREVLIAEEELEYEEA
jgi:S-DNA-T family DNA segregation ATPase FtsK/SpoIIIE